MLVYSYWSLQLLFEPLHRLTVKRGASVQELEQQNSEASDIDALVVRATVDDFGTHVLHRTAEGLPHLILPDSSGVAKIAEFDVKTGVQQ